MKKKLMYEVPDAELIELKLENNQMDGSSPVLGGPGPDDVVDEQGPF